MRIVLKTTGAGEFVLCAGNTSSQHSQDLQLDASEEVQVRKPLRSTAAKPIARGNTQASVGFVITREHATAKACEDYILEHHAAIPKNGELYITSEGSGQTTHKLSDAALLSTSGRQIGCTSIHSYRFTGGDYAASAP